jgi:hypothetical protein
MYRADWTHQAVNDLRKKVKTGLVRKYLLGVSRTCLYRHFPVWGGSTPQQILWRRGVNVQDETRFELAESDADDLDDGEEHGRDFVLVYRRLPTGALPVFEIISVLTNGELAAGY